ncbi:hypothetical protein [Treponema berlinense]|uniref:hypothetical protein n=1 Tax=Treponema berlinense TaxID=225004 RepID=UPI0026EB2737|nr:hypothetical protein [Treponema berlinense]
MLFEYPVMILNTSFGMFIRSDGRPDSYMKINILNVALNLMYFVRFFSIYKFGKFSFIAE